MFLMEGKRHHFSTERAEQTWCQNFARDAVWSSPIKYHPLKKRVVVDVLLRPRSRQAAGLAALLLAEVGFVEDLAAAVPRLPEPAVPSLHCVIFHDVAQKHQE